MPAARISVFENSNRDITEKSKLLVLHHLPVTERRRARIRSVLLTFHELLTLDTLCGANPKVRAQVTESLA
jgi:hypothetical protein